MTAIPWTRLSGDDIEQMLAVMLLRKHPLGRHVKANPGDGGIDVFIPDGPHARTGVNYQIKKFSEKIGESQKKQIRMSLKAAQQTTDEGYFVVRECLITCPLLPTDADYKWLSTASKRLAFTVDWRGLSHIEGWVSEFPDVVDYYLHNRADYFTRIMENAYEFAREAIKTTGAGSLSPHELVPHLANVQSLANQDPLYLYHFATMSEPPTSEAILASSKPGLVATSIQEIEENLYIAVDLFARFPDAVKLRPCTITFQATLESREAGDEYEDFLKFGTTAEITADIKLDLPGGLGGEFEMASLKIGPARTSLTNTFRYEVLNNAEETLSFILIEHRTQGAGILKSGAHIGGSDATEILGVEWRFDKSGKASSLTFSCENIEGRALMEVYQPFKFLASLKEGAQLRITDTLVPRRTFTHPLDGFDKDNQWSIAEPLMDYLYKIQQVVDTPVIIPDLMEIGKDGVEAIILAGRLLDGETILGTWNTVETIIPKIEDPAELPPTLVLRVPHALKLIDQVYPIGTVEAVHDSAVAELVDNESETNSVIRFTPQGGPNTMSIRLVSEPD